MGGGAADAGPRKPQNFALVLDEVENELNASEVERVNRHVIYHGAIERSATSTSSSAPHPEVVAASLKANTATAHLCGCHARTCAHGRSRSHARKHGRALDEKGNVLPEFKRGPSLTLKANIDLQRVNPKANPYLTHKMVDAADKSGVSDPRLKSRSAPKPRDEAREFKFVKPGTFVKQAESRRGAELQSILADIIAQPDGGAAGGPGSGAAVLSEEEAKRQAEFSLPHARGAVVMAEASPADVVVSEGHIEWWDAPFLPDEAEAACGYEACALEHTRFRSLVHHPVPIASGTVKPEVGSERCSAPWLRLALRGSTVIVVRHTLSPTAVHCARRPARRRAAPTQPTTTTWMVTHEDDGIDQSGPAPGPAMSVALFRLDDKEVSTPFF